MRKIRNAWLLIRTLERKELLGRRKIKWDDNIKYSFKNMDCGDDLHSCDL
jgi:hypothetical protein